MGLFDMVMIKDNHISIAGGIINAIKSVDQYLEQQNLQMEVEVVFSLFKVFLRILKYWNGLVVGWKLIC
jgi:nicotinate-nucleotide pyrophosphorylase (carboxylating)